MSGQDKLHEVLDEQGHKTGQILTRQEVHEKELWHEVANAWVMNTKGEVLLQLRAHDVDLNPDVWDVAVGTHVRPGEDPTNAAVRCLQSELGLTVAPDELDHLFNIQSANDAGNGKLHKVLGHVFLLKRDLDLSELTVNPDRIAQLAWKPLVQVMGEVGSTDSPNKYFPRQGEYYPKLFDALQGYNTF